VDWWIGDEAVLIDPPGEFSATPNRRLITSSSRQGQTSIARRHPPASVAPARLARAQPQPSGTQRVVLVIDVQALLAQRPEQRKAHANLLRTRVFELTRQLGTRLPVYVTLSKFDLLEGFEEFFARLSRSGREDLLGFTFSLDAVDDSMPGWPD
jgi:type VI secretion system protein ImpL